jgi:hypothetical protein
MQLRRGGVEQGLLDGGISGGYAAKQQPLVQEGRHLARMLSRFLDASKSYHGERRIHARRGARGCTGRGAAEVRVPRGFE